MHQAQDQLEIGSGSASGHIKCLPNELLEETLVDSFIYASDSLAGILERKSLPSDGTKRSFQVTSSQILAKT